MMMKAEILEYSTRDGFNQRGAYKMRTLRLLDRSEGVRLGQNIDFALSEEDALKLPSHDPDKCVGQTVEVGIKSIEPGYNGIFRLRGVLVHYGNGAAAPAVKK